MRKRGKYPIEKLGLTFPTVSISYVLLPVIPSKERGRQECSVGCHVVRLLEYLSPDRPGARDATKDPAFGP